MYKTLAVPLLAFSLMTFALGALQAGSSDEQAAAKKLGVFVGRWQSEGTVLETPLSHAGKISSTLECRWSPQKNFLVCEQLVTDSNRGSHTQLSIFSYNSTNKEYVVSTMAGPGRQPWSGTMVMSGTIWTFQGNSEANGKKIQIKTTNDFSVPDTETFKTEFSDDGGAHWTPTLQGTAHKVGS